MLHCKDSLIFMYVRKVLAVNLNGMVTFTCTSHITFHSRAVTLCQTHVHKRMLSSTSVLTEEHIT